MVSGYTGEPLLVGVTALWPEPPPIAFESATAFTEPPLMVMSEPEPLWPPPIPAPPPLPVAVTVPPLMVIFEPSPLPPPPIPAPPEPPVAAYGYVFVALPIIATADSCSLAIAGRLYCSAFYMYV